MKAKQHIDKMVNIYDQIGSLDEDLKALKVEAKTVGHDPAKLATIAKAISDGKSGKLRLKLESTLDTMDEYENA